MGENNCCDVFLRDDLIFQILRRLPEKSLMRFKSVCKPWHALIESRPPTFILKYHPEDGLGRESHFKLISLNDSEICQGLDLDLPLPPDSDWNNKRCAIIGSCEGVLCLYHHNISTPLALWNPATKQLRFLPPWPPLPIFNTNYFTKAFKLGFDVKTNDYKVVHILSFWHKYQGYENCYQVYSLRSNSWRLIDGAGFTVDQMHFVSVYLNGICHWKATNFGRFSKFPPKDYHSILSFDFSNELFNTMPYPDDVCNALSHGYTVGLVPFTENIGCAAFTSPYGCKPQRIQIWVLKEYGVHESWAKVYDIPSEPIPSSLPRMTGVSKSGFGFLIGNKRRLLLWDLANQQMKDSQLPVYVQDVVAYKESQVSIKGGDGASSL